MWHNHVDPCHTFEGPWNKVKPFERQNLLLKLIRRFAFSRCSLLRPEVASRSFGHSVRQKCSDRWSLEVWGGSTRCWFCCAYSEPSTPSTERGILRLCVFDDCRHIIAPASPGTGDEFSSKVSSASRLRAMKFRSRYSCWWPSSRRSSPRFFACNCAAVFGLQAGAAIRRSVRRYGTRTWCAVLRC